MFGCTEVFTKCNEVGVCGPCSVTQDRIVPSAGSSPPPLRPPAGLAAAKDARQDPLFNPPPVASIPTVDVEPPRPALQNQSYLPAVAESIETEMAVSVPPNPDVPAPKNETGAAFAALDSAGQNVANMNFQKPGAEDLLLGKPVVIVTEDARTKDQDEPEPEEGQTYNAQREWVKCASCALFVLAILASIALFITVMVQGFDAPTCLSDDRRLEHEESLSGDFILQRNLKSLGAFRAVKAAKPKNCMPCGEGTIVLPLGQEWEKSLDTNMRAVLYFIGLGWCFLGIAIVCDQFMAAIEEITSTEKTVWLKVHGGSQHKFHVHIWNPTVANLTLMALGSSAPEILLSVIELMGNKFFSGELGPSTIVGSAAFNLLVITAVCISSIPAPDIRKIDQMEVFVVTATTSLFAYIWLLFMLQVHTPDMVDVGEALITLFAFPVLIIVAFLADRGWLKCKRRVPKQEDGGAPEPLEGGALETEQRKLQAQYGKQISLSHVKMLTDASAMASINTQAGEGGGLGKAMPKSRAHYRKSMMASAPGGNGRGVIDTTGNEVTFGFSDRKYVVMECAGAVTIKVTASRAPGCPVEIRYYTVDGQAKAGVRYRHVEGTLRFDPDQTEQVISVPIVDNDVCDADEEFSVELSDVQAVRPCRLGIAWTQVWVLNDDEPGTLNFAVDEVRACEGVSSIAVGVSRINGTMGKIQCHYETGDGTAFHGSDYTGTEGTLELLDGQENSMIEIPLLNSKSATDRRFRVILNNPSPGVKFDPTTDGGEESAICEVLLAANVHGCFMQRYVRKCFSPAKCKLACADWKEQFPAAFYCGGDAKEQSTAGTSAWIFHGISLFWKVIFAFTPPVKFGGGWPCFIWALSMIGIVTAIVGDMAGLLGCCLSIPDDITAITLVALGTSLPDTFASRTAAQHDPNADNSIGNVTGSNSVNVFLGLGLPWTVGALVWSSRGPSTEWKEHIYKKKTYEEQFLSRYPDGGFLVPAGSLGFSVSVFVATAIICITLLFLRRRWYGGELGGPKGAQKRDSLFLCFLWFVYIGASIGKSLSDKAAAGD